MKEKNLVSSEVQTLPRVNERNIINKLDRDFNEKI